MKHLTAPKIAEMYGMTARHWIRMAAVGKVPGAHQPGGQGGKWLFEAQAFAKWFKGTTRNVESWPVSTNAKAVPSIRPASNAKAWNTEPALKQQIAGWLKNASGNPSHQTTR